MARVGDGLTLTGAGYLPPAVVVEMWTATGWATRYPWLGKGNREEHARPVGDVREAATRLGLLKLAKGRLTATKAGTRLLDDPVSLWWHTAARMPTVRGEVEQLAGQLVLLLLASERAVDDALIAEGLASLGWVQRSTRAPMATRDVIIYTRETLHLLEWLGLLSDRWLRGQQEPSSAAVAFARAVVVGPDVAPPPAGPDAGVELTVTLRDVEPPVWRRLQVSTSLTLRETHDVLQAAMGWEGHHLHLFDVGGTLYGDVEDFDGELGSAATTTLADVRQLTDTFRYECDFGDGWEHEVRLGTSVPTGGHVATRLVDGTRACPPEDCGGPGGYEELLQVLAGPRGEEYDQLRQWPGRDFDPEAFDAAAVDDELARLDRRRRWR